MRKPEGWDWFDNICLILLIPITIFALTPSSYGVVLNQLGFGGEGLVWGSPRPIRSDEWAVWTPYIQMAVLNGFERFNELSTYHHDLKGFNAVPLADWALIFKPLMWPFWLFEPARAFALHHGLVMILFLIGWKKLLVGCLRDFDISERRCRGYASFFSILLFFTGFVQFWWTTLGPLLAISPWLLIVVMQWRQSFIHYLVLFYTATVWLLSHTYPPIIISIAYFGLVLLFVHQPGWWRKSLVKLCLTALACLASCAVVLFYYRDIIPIMMNTVYPGQRISNGGDGFGLVWLSSFLPFITHSRYDDLLSLNICEVGTLGSLLPLVVACFIQPDFRHPTLKRAFVVCSFGLVLTTLWMLAPIPATFGKFFLLDKVPAHRMVFLQGLVVNYLAILTFGSGRVVFSRLRATIFVVVVIFSYFLPCFLSLIDWFGKKAPELAALVILILWMLFKRMKFWKERNNHLILGSIILLPNIIAYADFNPVQRAFPIFDLKNRAAIKTIESEAQKSEPHWVIDASLPGAVLSGLGVNSFTTVLTQPNLLVFRSIYPDMNEESFNQLFNRYAHVMISSSELIPSNPSLDIIRIPLKDVDETPVLNYVHHSYIDPENISIGGVLDSVLIDGDKMILGGWAWHRGGYIAGPFSKSDIIAMQVERRKDVALAFQVPSLEFSGFRAFIDLSKYNIQEIKKTGVCIYSLDEEFGLHRIETKNLPLQWQCHLER